MAAAAAMNANPATTNMTMAIARPMNPETPEAVFHASRRSSDQMRHQLMAEMVETVFEPYLSKGEDRANLAAISAPAVSSRGSRARSSTAEQVTLNH